MIGMPGMKWRIGDHNVDSARATQVGAEVDWDGDDVERGGTCGRI
jgi:hypothetical protein